MSSRLRQRVRENGLLPTIRYVLGTAVLERFGVSTLEVFVADSPVEAPPAELSIASSMHDLSTTDIAALHAYGGERSIRSFERYFSRGFRAIIARVGGGLACVCWLTRQNPYLPVGGGVAQMIENCFTLPQYRGRGLYAITLRHAINQTSGAVYIECSKYNSSSIRGIEKAGFRHVGTLRTIGSRKYWKAEACAAVMKTAATTGHVG